MVTPSPTVCSALIKYLKDFWAKEATLTIGKISNHVKSIKLPQIWLADSDLLHEACATLSSLGTMFFLPCNSNPQDSLLILDIVPVLSEVHASLKQVRTSTNGIIKESELCKALATLLTNRDMNAELAVQYLLITQFCTKVLISQLVTKSTVKEEVHYFFPNLVLASRPDDIWSTEGNRYSNLYIWCLRCAAEGEFFTPRYLHTLFIQLIKFWNEKDSTGCLVWKNGIYLASENGMRFSIEVLENTRLLQFSIQCMKGCEEHFPRQRSMLIGLIKSLKENVCPNVQVEEYLLHSQNSLPPFTKIAVSEVATAIVQSKACIIAQRRDELPHQIAVSDLLLFDAFKGMDEATIQAIFTHKYSEDYVPSGLISSVLQAVKANALILKSLHDRATNSRITYNFLYAELHQYTIFPQGNLCVSFELF